MDEVKIFIISCFKLGEELLGEEEQRLTEHEKEFLKVLEDFSDKIL